MLKKSLAFLLTFVLLLSAIPVMYASADDNRIIIKDLVISFPVWTGKGDCETEIDLPESVNGREFVKADELENLMLSGKPIGKENYTVYEKEGKTFISFKEEYLKKLNEGNSFIDVIFKRVDFDLAVLKVTEDYSSNEMKINMLKTDEGFSVRFAGINEAAVRKDLFVSMTKNGEKVDEKMYDITYYYRFGMNVKFNDEYVKTLKSGDVFVLEFLTGKVYITFINGRLGDLNSDDKISAADARLALRLAAKLDSSTRELDVIADVDKNGAVNASDARSILRVTAKLQTVFDSVDTNI